jgi:ankyrin repeat protein
VLHVASCWNGVVPMVRFLVKQCGMAIDTTNCKEQTALHLTTMSTKNSSAVSWLVTTGQASVNATDMDGETALHYTALYNNVSTARILLLHGASVEARTQRGETALGIACRQGHTELCRVLVESGNANIHAAQCPSQQGSLLHAHLSAPASNLAMIEFLIEKGVNVYAVDDGEWNETALHLAIRLSGSSMDIVRALVQAGGARLVQAVGGFDKSTALHYAAKRGNVLVAQCLVEGGCRSRSFLKAVNGQGATALDLAVERKHLDVVQYLTQVTAHARWGTWKWCHI